MRVALTSLIVLAAVGPAAATPAGDLVFVWVPPGANAAPIAAAARRAGAAVIDRSPTPAAPVAAAPLVARGIEAYDALRFDDARASFDQARDVIDRTGDADLTTAQLADLWLYRGLVASQQGDSAAAWDDLVESAAIAPDRMLDPARFPPRVVAELDRARAAVATSPRAQLAVTAPASCETRVDGTQLALPATLPVGAHWLRVTCADRAPWSGRVALAAPSTAVAAAPAAYVPLDPTDVLVQARTSGARAFVTAEVHGEVATARLIAIDGRELARRTIALAPNGDLAPVGAAVDALLAPAAVAHAPWYQSRWVWAAGAAAIAAAVLIPITAAIVHDDRATDATLRTTVPWP